MSMIRPSRRQLLKASGAGAVAPLLAGLPRPARAAAAGSNVVVICLDEVCVRDMALLSLPNISRLESEGVSCSSAWCASPVCAPTRQSWLTALYPPEHGVISNSYVLNTGYRTVVDVFKDAGYTTAAFGKLHTNNDAEAAGAGFGFQSIWNTGSADFSAVKATYKATGTFAPYYDTADKAEFDLIKTATGKTFSAQIVHVSQHDDYIVTQEALAFLDDHAADTSPFFLYVSLLAPHLPLKAPMELVDRSTDTWYYNYVTADASGVARMAGGRTDSPGWVRQNANYNDWSALSADQRALLTAKYWAYLEYADYLVGLVLDRIDSLGLDEDTLVIFMSDHGDHNGHRGLYLKQSCFSEAAQTPLIFRLPGTLSAGTSYDGLVSAIDILPTAAGLVGLGGSLSDISGLDLSDALTGTSGATEREVVIMADYYGTTSLKGGMTGIIDSDGMMTVYYQGGFVSGGYVTKASYGEVYDLVDDPDQEVNIVSSSSATKTAHTSIRKAHWAALRPLEYALEKET